MLNNSNGYLSASSSDSAVVSQEKSDSMNIASNTGEDNIFKSRKKRKVTLNSSSSNPNRVWSKDDEIMILKGIIDYQNRTGVDYCSDSTAFFDHIKSAIDAKVSKDQLVRKIQKLKAKFKDNSRKSRCFINSHDSAKFDMSKVIWGRVKTECVGSNINEATGSKSKAFVKHEEVAKNEPENDEAVTKGKFKINHGSTKGVSENVDKCTKKESEEDGVDDEILNLQDALESTFFEGLSTTSLTHMRKNLRTLNAEIRKELSDGWSSLLARENQLKIKKFHFAAKLAEATL